MATNHGVIGDELGFFVRMNKLLDQWGDGGASATIDGLDRMKTEAYTVFDTDVNSKEFLGQVETLLNNLYASVQALRTRCTQTFESWCYQRLRGELNSTATSVRGILGDLYLQMHTDSKVVKTATGTVGADTAGGDNTCTYEIVTSATDPWDRANDNIQTQDFLVVCRQDAQTGGMEDYQERFSVSGNITGTEVNPYAVMVPGTDENFANRLQNPTSGSVGDNDFASSEIPFENFDTGQVPYGWTAVVGAGATDFLKDTANGLFGDNSLQCRGDTGGTLHKIKQDANDFYSSDSDDQKFYPGDKYCIGVWCKCDTGVAAGVWKFYMDGTAYSAGATEYATKDLSGTPPTSYTWYNGTMKMPKSIPTDMEAILEFTTAITSGEDVFFDGPVFARYRYFHDAGFYFAIIAKGNAKAIAGTRPDFWEFSTTNSEAGLIQTFMTARTDVSDPLPKVRPDFQIMLPHDATASSQYSEVKAE